MHFQTENLLHYFIMNKTISDTLSRLGIKETNTGLGTGAKWIQTHGPTLGSTNPSTGETVAEVTTANLEDYGLVIARAARAYSEWRHWTAPRRAEIVRQISIRLREHKEELGRLVTIEAGKILQEGMGEVQEMIDICDFAVGLGRQMNGTMLRSERPDHKMYEQYHPLGIVAIVTSFNFPVAVWAWNTMLAVIGGNVVIWKPSSKTPLTAIAVHKIIAGTLASNNVPEGVFNLFIAKSSVLGDTFLEDSRIPLFSVTGSTRAGQHVAAVVGRRFGRTILELGGNNAAVIMPSANLDLAMPSIVFGAVGTAGQRCTTTRRVLVHEDIYDEVRNRLITSYTQFEKRIGDPLRQTTLIGPLIDRSAVEAYTNAINEAVMEGGKVLYGNRVLSGRGFESGTFVVPSIVEAGNGFNVVQRETFAPILYLIKVKSLEDAIEKNNDVPQGLSSTLFTTSLMEMEKWLSENGSDCGIANVNTSTSGAEIGGAFGGEKETGGGRESGSDAWKAYMRRQTVNINYGDELPLAQGIKFEF
jgi:aldehyde dehydrogenase (NAD+)